MIVWTSFPASSIFWLTMHLYLCMYVYFLPWQYSCIHVYFLSWQYSCMYVYFLHWQYSFIYVYFLNWQYSCIYVYFLRWQTTLFLVIYYIPKTKLNVLVNYLNKLHVTHDCCWCFDLHTWKTSWGLTPCIICGIQISYWDGRTCRPAPVCPLPLDSPLLKVQ